MKVTNLEYGRKIEKRRNNIYVKHIPKDNFSDEDLEKLFAPIGEIKSAVVLRDQEGNSKGFGFVCFSQPEDAEEAYKKMNNNSIFKDLPPLYVNFAMKKGERLEHLQKKREELFKNAQKMTIFAKIKDENSVNSEDEFEGAIRGYLKAVFGKDYEPKSIKIRFETKNAFITMNSQRDAEEFIRKFQEFSKENQTTLFFNLYKSKVERISANAYFKKYNTFNQEKMPQQQGRYKKYNEFENQVSEFPYSSINQQNIGGTMRYNNFDEGMGMNQMGNAMNTQMFSNPNTNQFQQGRYMSYNTFNNQVNQGNQINQPQKETKPSSQFVLDPNDEEAIGEYLYGFIDKLYPDQSSKITGMLMEIEPATRYKLITSRPEELAKIIKSAYNQLIQK